MQSEHHLSELRKFMSTVVPFWQTLGLELKEIAPGRAVFEAGALPGLMQNSILHGGVLASIVDSACAVAAISLIFPARYATTINLQVSYLKPVTQGRIRAEGRCLKAGKNVLFCDALVFDEQQALVCTATSQLHSGSPEGGRVLARLKAPWPRAGLDRVLSRAVYSRTCPEWWEVYGIKGLCSAKNIAYGIA